MHRIWYVLSLIHISLDLEGIYPWIGLIPMLKSAKPSEKLKSFRF